MVVQREVPGAVTDRLGEPGAAIVTEEAPGAAARKPEEELEEKLEEEEEARTRMQRSVGAPAVLRMRDT
jgi:hypothetical protein